MKNQSSDIRELFLWRRHGATEKSFFSGRYWRPVVELGSCQEHNVPQSFTTINLDQIKANGRHGHRAELHNPEGEKIKKKQKTAGK